MHPLKVDESPQECGPMQTNHLCPSQTPWSQLHLRLSPDSLAFIFPLHKRHTLLTSNQRRHGVTWWGEIAFFRPLISLCKCRVHKSCLLLFTTIWFMRPHSNKAEQGRLCLAVFVVTEWSKRAEFSLKPQLFMNVLDNIILFRLSCHVWLVWNGWGWRTFILLQELYCEMNNSVFCTKLLTLNYPTFKFIPSPWIRGYIWQTEIFTYLLSLWNKSILQQTNHTESTEREYFSHKAWWIIQVKINLSGEMKKMRGEEELFDKSYNSSKSYCFTFVTFPSHLDILLSILWHYKSWCGVKTITHNCLPCLQARWREGIKEIIRMFWNRVAWGT